MLWRSCVKKTRSPVRSRLCWRKHSQRLNRPALGNTQGPGHCTHHHHTCHMEVRGRCGAAGSESTTSCGPQCIAASEEAGTGAARLAAAIKWELLIRRLPWAPSKSAAHCGTKLLGTAAPRGPTGTTRWCRGATFRHATFGLVPPCEVQCAQTVPQGSNQTVQGQQQLRSTRTAPTKKYKRSSNANELQGYAMGLAGQLRGTLHCNTAVSGLGKTKANVNEQHNGESQP